ncbi:MAG: cupredoxin domain-containing protein [Gammaproteobacteria bacterium]|nr:cupredoxin domain-containing protein [Gammaproteobacteria bacterium]
MKKLSTLLLSLLFALSLSQALAAEPQVIEVKLDSYYIKPEKITVKRDQPVTLNLTNEASLLPHNLVIKAPEAGIDIAVDVSAGKAASVSFTPTKTGSYEMFCSKEPPFVKSHKERGMHGVLEVVD